MVRVARIIRVASVSPKVAKVVRVAWVIRVASLATKVARVAISGLGSG
jgi:hypothetical protein